MSARCASSDTDHTCVYEGIKCTSSVYPCVSICILMMSLWVFVWRSLCVSLPLQGLRNKPKKTGHVKPDLIDVDLVRGEGVKNGGFLLKENPIDRLQHFHMCIKDTHVNMRQAAWLCQPPVAVNARSFFLPRSIRLIFITFSIIHQKSRFNPPWLGT